MSNSSRKAKKASKTGKKLIRTTKTQMYREYEQGYKNGESYLASVEGKEDGYNDVLECMRIEEYA